MKGNYGYSDKLEKLEM